MADVDYASNAKANTGVTLGSIGVGLGVLNAMRNNNCGDGLLGNVLATNNGAFNSLTQTINCISSSVTALTNRVDAITSEIVPICKVCPQPMQRFNTWATPTAQSPDCVSCSAAQGASA